jgi:hypothetical protein
MRADGIRRRGPGKTAQAERRPHGEPVSMSDGGFRPQHLFIMLTMVAAGGGVLVTGSASPARAVFVSLAIFSVGLASYVLYRTVWPLVVPRLNGDSRAAGNRDGATLEAERATVLRTINDLEFDRAMGKLSEADFLDMRAGLDIRRPTYRELIERDLVTRMASTGSVAVAEEPAAAAGAAAGDRPASRACRGCGTTNDPDAQFCKTCGNRLYE